MRKAENLDNASLDSSGGQLTGKDPRPLSGGLVKDAIECFAVTGSCGREDVKASGRSSLSL